LGVSEKSDGGAFIVGEGESKYLSRKAFELSLTQMPALVRIVKEIGSGGLAGD
jgi:hypothetical protein